MALSAGRDREWPQLKERDPPSLVLMASSQRASWCVVSEKQLQSPVLREELCSLSLSLSGFLSLRLICSSRRDEHQPFQLAGSF